MHHEPGRRLEVLIAVAGDGSLQRHDLGEAGVGSPGNEVGRAFGGRADGRRGAQERRWRRGAQLAQMPREGRRRAPISPLGHRRYDRGERIEMGDTEDEVVQLATTGKRSHSHGGGDAGLRLRGV